MKYDVYLQGPAAKTDCFPLLFDWTETQYLQCTAVPLIHPEFLKTAAYKWEKVMQKIA